MGYPLILSRMSGQICPGPVWGVHPVQVLSGQVLSRSCLGEGKGILGRTRGYHPRTGHGYPQQDRGTSQTGHGYLRTGQVYLGSLPRLVPGGIHHTRRFLVHSDNEYRPIESPVSHLMTHHVVCLLQSCRRTFLLEFHLHWQI